MKYAHKLFLISSLAFVFIVPIKLEAWGFFAHQRINKMAIFILPAEMMPFYKRHLKYLMENSVKPDMRRGVVPNEAPRHFIDQEVYEKDSALFKMPHFWKDALAKYTEDTLMKHGMVPYQISLMKFELVQAFKENDARKILKISAEIGHYIADANVPLHTTKNYNGQLTNQMGVHGLWESRLPELYANNYDFFVGQAQVIENTNKRIWQNLRNANSLVDSVLIFEKLATERITENKKYVIEDHNGIPQKTYSRAYSQAYHKMLNSQVERQMRASVKMIGDVWFTCWVEAGQPDLNKIINFELSDFQKKEDEKEEKTWLQKLFGVREE